MWRKCKCFQVTFKCNWFTRWICRWVLYKSWFHNSWTSTTTFIHWWSYKWNGWICWSICWVLKTNCSSLVISDLRNIDPSSFRAITKALTGEREGLKQLGIVLKQTMLIRKLCWRQQVLLETDRTWKATATLTLIKNIPMHLVILITHLMVLQTHREDLKLN